MTKYFQLLLSITITFLCQPTYSQNSSVSIINSRLVLPAVKINKNIFEVEFNVIDANSELELLLAGFTKLETSGLSEDDELSSFSNLILTIPRLELDDMEYEAAFRLTDLDDIRFELISTKPSGAVEPDEDIPPPVSCTMDMDLTNGDDNPVITLGWAADINFVMDGGPAPDGIPPIENPLFGNSDNTFVSPWIYVIGVKIGDDVRAYPHDVMDYHEIVNDTFMVNGIKEPITVSFCPLTGTSMLWQGNMTYANPTFGTSGLLYNSNLIMYDRQTSSYWSQMLEQAISGPAMLAIPDKLQVVETTMDTWLRMYPESRIMSRLTGFSRNYDVYPYGNYRDSEGLLFLVNNSGDNRLPKKQRVVGVTNRDEAMAYRLSELSVGVEVINDTIGDLPIVVAGSSDDDFGVIYSRQTSDCSVLEFEPVEDRLPIVMQDNEGNEWDIFGVAQSGPRKGESLTKTNSYISYWFAWAAFFPHTEIF